MDAKENPKRLVTIGGQEVSLEAHPPGPSGEPGEIKVALEPAAQGVVYEVDRVPGRWGMAIAITLFVLAGIGLAVVLFFVIRAIVRGLAPARA